MADWKCKGKGKARSLCTYKEAYTGLTIHNKLSNEMFSQKNKHKIASLQGKHEIELRDQQLKINKLEIAAQHKQEWFLVEGLITLILMARLVYYQNH